jgi:hypothetical protein
MFPRPGSWIPLLLLIAIPVEASPTLEPSLRGSPASMQEQHRVAQRHGLDFYRTREQIEQAVRHGEQLVPLPGDENYEVADFVDPPYIHPVALVFVERLARGYRAACGRRLVVTSAVRAIEEQPWNSHPLSVHPTGIAVDFRIHDEPDCQRFLEARFLELEALDVINGIRERRPPHYHVAVYPEAYLEYVRPELEAEAEALRLEQEARAAEYAAEQRDDTFRAGMRLVLALIGAALAGIAAIRWGLRGG